MVVRSMAEFEERYLPETFEAKLTDEERGRRAVARALDHALTHPTGNVANADTDSESAPA